MFEPYLSKWGLVPDGASIVTPRGRLLPVRQGGSAAMLKISTDVDEMLGGVLLRWWDGRGAARVIEMEGEALLIERALGQRSLKDMSHSGSDDEATRILCDAVGVLHSTKANSPDGLLSLDVWFVDLWSAAQAHGGPLAISADMARLVLGQQQEIVPLHGDIHHDNVLDFEARGWLAIDPKRLVGDRAFDYCNIFCNPDIEHPMPAVATIPERFQRRLEIVTAHSGIDRRRLLQWIVAWSGLSASWIIGDGDYPAVDLAVGALAVAGLQL